MRLPVRIQGGVEDTTAGLIEPSTKFGERHNVLTARSISLPRSGGTVIEVLNPTLVPVTVYARENVGKFQPLLSEVCQIFHPSPTINEVSSSVNNFKLYNQSYLCTNNASMLQDHLTEAKIDQLMSGIKGLTLKQERQLQTLLWQY